MAESFNRASVQLATTSPTDAYQAPTTAGARAVVASCLVANVSAATATITLAVTTGAGGVLAQLANTIEVPANSSLELIVNKLVLLTGEKLVVTAGAADALHVTVSSLEITA